MGLAVDEGIDMGNVVVAVGNVDIPDIDVVVLFSQFPSNTPVVVS